ncbi:MAG: APC family permease [Oscillospiraceae bacterium]|nr:APC family permease [Oscillospiraceae bacterium]
MRSIKSILLGNALSNEQLSHEKLSRIWGLPIMASDAVSSVAYAVEEILLALVPLLGLVAVRYVGLISIPIIALLLMLIFSYAQIINHYPGGGGAYVVSKENFGRKPSLLAASCLVVDYILTVAVSISSSTAAITSAFPALEGQKVIIALVCITVVTLINLRGVSESSKIFGVPTYLFIATMFVLIITGFVRSISGTLMPIDYGAVHELIPEDTLSGITLILFLRAFSSGCAALTGVEAVSDAVPGFRDPPTKTARHVLYMLGTIIILIFGGTCLLAGTLKVIPLPGVTVMSQMANSVFGKGFMFYLLQFTTALILLLAANTAYNGLPILLSILASDRFMPLQFSHRGTKLSFSNGIMFIFITAGIMLVAFNADTHTLIPFYAVGVLISFTISQFGMFIKWTKLKEKGWHYKCIINGVGALVTFVAFIVVFVMKFSGGAWALAIVIPLIMLFMSYTHRHYALFGQAISIKDYKYHYKESTSKDKLPCIVLIHYLSKAALKTFDYANDISSDVTALHISTNPQNTEALKKQWDELGIGIPLTIIPTPYRDVLRLLDKYIIEREAKLSHGQTLTVVLTKFVSGGWQDKIFHNQTTFFIASKLARHKHVATVSVPFIYSIKGKEPKGQDAIEEFSSD